MFRRALHEQMRVNEHADHAEAFVLFDEPHAAHVAGEVDDDVHALGGGGEGGVFFRFKIGDDVLALAVDLDTNRSGA